VPRSQPATRWLPGATVAVRLTPFRLTLTHPSPTAAAAELGQMRLLQFEALLRSRLPAKPQLAERWYRALFSAGRRARTVGDRVQLVVDAGDLDPLRLWPLLR